MWGRGPISLIFMWIQYILLIFFSRVYAFRTTQREQALFTTVYLAQCLASNRYSKYTWWNLYLVTQSCLTLCNPMNCSLPGSSVHGDSPGKNTGVGCHALLPGDHPNLAIKPRFPALQVDSLPSEPPGKPASIPGLGRYLGGGMGYPLQYSCLGNPHGQRSLADYSPWGRKWLSD